MTSAPDDAGAHLVRLDRKRTVALASTLAVLGALTVWRLGSAPARAPYEIAGLTMGTTYSVRVDAEMGPAAREALRAVVEQRLQRINRMMSTYDTSSELSRFNRSERSDPFPLSGEIIEVLTLAREISERSDGAFDVTVAPLVDAWGFGAGAEPLPARPDAATLDALTARVGYERIDIDPDAGTVTKSHPETVVDLSAIAKGYGVAAVAESLRDRGLTSFLVEVGGELEAVGRRRDGRPWRVGIEAPDPASRRVYATVDLVDQAIATSGDYRDFFEDDHGTYAHIIDPRTGWPIPYAGIAVTVLHPDAAAADAWATALTVLGPDAGFVLASSEGVAALFVTRAREGFRARSTPAFDRRVEGFTEVGRG